MGGIVLDQGQIYNRILAVSFNYDSCFVAKYKSLGL